ncbi:hypothetical protein BT69DRAFT_1290607, partial [Atractiella rhizophila]
MGWLLEGYIGLTMLMMPASALVHTVERKQGEQHQRNYVHGDVRETNILLHGRKSSYSMDFDWAGKIGEA